MLFRIVCIFAAIQSSGRVLAGGQSENKEVKILREEFFSLEDASNGQPHSFLRRQLTTSQAVCVPFPPATGSVHGNCGSRPNYSCSCLGGAGDLAIRAECSYCTVETSHRQDLCLMTGSSTTFSDPGAGLKTCSCDYDAATGMLKTDCSTPPAEPDYEPWAPYDPVPVPAPEEDRADPIGNETDALLSCQPNSPSDYNVFVCLDILGGAGYCDNTPITCGLLPNYGCSCIDSDQKSCSYCQVRTAKAVICQVIGNTMTFEAPDSTTKTCTCEATENGGAVQVCSPPPSEIVVRDAASWNMALP